MSNLFRFFSIFSIVVSTGLCHAQTTKTCDQNCISFEDHFRLLPFFKTTKQYLSFLKNLKLISEGDFVEIEAELKKLDILDSAVTEWPTLKNQDIFLNKIKIVRFSETDFLIPPVARLKVNPRISFKENYLNFIQQLSSEKKFSWFNILFIDSALAAANANKKEAALVSLTTVAAAFYSGAEIVGTCIPGALISTVGQVSQVIKSIVHPFRRMLYNGTVQCLRGDYFLHQPELKYYDSVTKYKEHYDWITKHDKDMLGKVYGFCYGLVNSGDKTVADALEQYNCEKPECIKPIPLAEVSQILNKSPSETPKCTTETAQLVQKFKRQQAEKDEAEVLNRLVATKITPATKIVIPDGHK